MPAVGTDDGRRPLFLAIRGRPGRTRSGCTYLRGEESFAEAPASLGRLRRHRLLHTVQGEAAIVTMAESSCLGRGDFFRRDIDPLGRILLGRRRLRSATCIVLPRDAPMDWLATKPSVMLRMLQTEVRRFGVRPAALAQL